MADRLRRSRRTIAAGAVVAIAALALTGALTAGASGTTHRMAAARTASKSLLGPLPKKKVAIQVWDAYYFPKTPIGAAEKQVDTLFMKQYPNITVVHKGFPYNAYWRAKILAAEASHQGPDIMMTYSEADLDKGFVPLNGYVNETPGFKAKSPLIGVEELADPSLHQLPLTTDPFVLHINKTLFHKAGLNPSDPPTTLAALLTDCKKLNAAGITPIDAGFQDGYEGDSYIYFGFASQTFSRAQIRAFEQGKLGWNSPPMQAALNDLLKLNSAKCFESNAGAITESESYSDFLAGKAAMDYTDTSASYPEEVKNFGASNLEVVPLPRVPGDAYHGAFLQLTSYYDWAITSWSSQCRASWAYLSFLNSPAAQTVLYKVGGLFPNVTSVKATSPIAAEQTELDLLTNAGNHSGPVPANSEEIATAEKLYAELIGGQLSLSAFTSQVDASAQTAPSSIRPFVSSPPCN